MVDSFDKQRLGMVHEYLHLLAEDRVLAKRSIPVMIIMNKCDLPGHVSAGEVRDFFEFEHLKATSNLEWQIVDARAKNPKDVSDIFSMFEHALKMRRPALGVADGDK